MIYKFHMLQFEFIEIPYFYFVNLIASNVPRKLFHLVKFIFSLMNFHTNGVIYYMCIYRIGCEGELSNKNI
jgi:hypothetical protein